MVHYEEAKFFAGILAGVFMSILASLIVNSFFLLMQSLGAFNISNLFILYLESTLFLIILAIYFVKKYPI
jgi:hypothetical protein